MSKSLLDPVVGISVYIIDVYTNGEVDAESLPGLNAKLRRGQHLLADNLVLAAAPLRNDAGVSAFRIKLHAIERVHAPGEIGDRAAEFLHELGPDRGYWIDVPLDGSSISTIPRFFPSLAGSMPAGGPPRATTPPYPPHSRDDRPPTPPPFIVMNGLIYTNHLTGTEYTKDYAPVDSPQAPSDVTMPALVPHDSLEPANGDEMRARPLLGGTQLIDHRAYRFGDDTPAPGPAAPVDETQILSLHELQRVFGWKSPTPTSHRALQGRGVTDASQDSELA